MDFDAFYKTYGSMIRRTAISFAGPNDCDDLAQEIVLASLRAWEKFRGDASEKTYIYRIAQNCGVNYLRKRRPHELFDEAIDKRTPETIALKKQTQQRLAQMIRQLPLIHRQPMVLRMEGLSYDEIAEVLGIKTNGVGVRIHRATELLKAMNESEK